MKYVLHTCQPGGEIDYKQLREVNPEAELSEEAMDYAYYYDNVKKDSSRDHQALFSYLES